MVYPHRKGMKTMNKTTLKKIEKTFKEMDSDKSIIALELLSKASFLEETLNRLEKEISDSEVIGEMSQGSYSINRSNPAIKTYNTTVANYQKLMKQIMDLLPQKEELDAFDEFDKF